MSEERLRTDEEIRESVREGNIKLFYRLLTVAAIIVAAGLIVIWALS